MQLPSTLGYFNLNRPVTASGSAPADGDRVGRAESGAESERPVFRGRRDKPTASPTSPPAAAPSSAQPQAPASKALPVWEQCLMYAGVLIGVIFSSAVQEFRKGSVGSLNISLATLVVGAVIALVIIPGMFKQLQVDPTTPFIVRFGLFVQNGVFWHVVASSIGKSYGA
jgi:hypothetical protein